MIKFNIRGYELCVTFGFLFTLSILLLTDSPSIKFIALSACVIHELGHFIASVILNVKFGSIKLWAGGINIQLSHRIISYEKELAVLISGPVLNLVFALFYILNGMEYAAETHLTLGVFNLLPFSALDGGCIIMTIFHKNEKNGIAFQKTAAVLTGIIILVLSFFIGPLNIFSAAIIILLTANEIF